MQISELSDFYNTEEKEELEVMADLYSIFVATENIEKAYIRDSINAETYTSACSKLIAQFKTCLASLGPKFSIDFFLESYDIKCPAARHRLVDIGMPATSEHSSNIVQQPAHSSKHIAETIQAFITLIDSLKLNMVAADQVYPLLSELLQSINKINIASLSSLEWRSKLTEWLIKLNKMQAHAELDSSDARQLIFDLEKAYNSFYQALSQ